MQAVVEKLAEVRVTRTPLGGSADPAVTEEYHAPRELVLGVDVALPETVGAQTGNLRLHNPGNQFSGWVPGDGVLVEVKQDGAWTTVLDGYVARPVIVPRLDAPVLEVEVRGWTTLLDLVNLDAEQSFASGTAYTRSKPVLLS